MFHLTQSMFRTMPAMSDVMQQNPALMNQFAQAAMNSAGSGTGSAPAAAASAPRPSRGGGGGGGFNIGSMLGSLMGMGGGGGDNSDSQSDQSSSAGSTFGGGDNTRREMRGPSGMDHILSSLTPPGSGLGGARQAPPSPLSAASSQEVPMPPQSAPSRIHSMATANAGDLQQHGQSLTNARAASSGYRRRTTDGMRLNI